MSEQQHLLRQNGLEPYITLTQRTLNLLLLPVSPTVNPFGVALTTVFDVSFPAQLSEQWL